VTHPLSRILRPLIFVCTLFTLSSASAQSPTGGTCDKPGRPCLDQPHDTDPNVTGQVKLDDKNKPLAGSKVVIAVNNREIAQAQLDSTTGKFLCAIKPALRQGDAVKVTYSNSVDSGATLEVSVAAQDVTPGTSSSLYTLALAGINATGSSTSGATQQYFASFDLLSPLPWLGSKACPQGEATYPLAQKCWVWLNPRIASVPATSSAAISSLSSPASLSSGISGQTIGQITQSFEFQAGLEFYLKAPWNGRQFGWKGSWARTTVSLIMGGGSVTPFSPIGTASEFGLNGNLAQQFVQNPKLETQFPQLAAALCSYGLASTATFTCPATPTTKPASVAFTFPNRTRFYRDYFAGFRLRTFYFKGDCPYPKKDDSDEQKASAGKTCKVENTYPGTFDFRFGQDETVTGRHLRGVVLNMTGTYPLPGTNGAIRIFGSSFLRMHKNINSTALILIPSSKFTALDDPTVVVQPILPSDQDYYRLGLGGDLIPLIAKWVNPPPKSQ